MLVLISFMEISSIMEPSRLSVREGVVFALLRGPTKGFMKTLKAFIKSFEAPQRRVKIEI